MPPQPAVTLTEDEQTTLENFVHRGKTDARILLKSADGWSTAELVAAFDVCEATVTNVRGRFAQRGLEAVLYDQVQQHRRSVLSGLQTAHLIAVACSPVPDGHDHWTVRELSRDRGGVGLCDEHFTQYDPRAAQKNELKRGPHEQTSMNAVARAICSSWSNPWQDGGMWR